MPRAMSVGECTFDLHCRAHGLTPVRELQFAKEQGRKWRFDFAWPERMIAVEINGGTWSSGRHNRGSYMHKEYEKLNHAALLGWRVFQFTTEIVASGEAIDMVLKVLNS